MTTKYITPILLYLTVLGGAAGCSNNTGPKNMGPVDFRVSTAANTAGTTTVRTSLSSSVSRPTELR